MRHARFDIAELAVDRHDVVLKAAYLLVAGGDDGAIPQWEVVAYALAREPLAQRPCRVDLTTLDGRYFRGDALVVRSVEGAHVLRGNGPLEGFDPATDLDRG
jgi:hypothetical protein